MKDDSRQDYGFRQEDMHCGMVLRAQRFYYSTLHLPPYRAPPIFIMPCRLPRLPATCLLPLYTAVLYTSPRLKTGGVRGDNAANSSVTAGCLPCAPGVAARRH